MSLAAQVAGRMERPHRRVVVTLAVLLAAACGGDGLPQGQPGQDLAVAASRMDGAIDGGANCTNGILDGNETDVDCGGTSCPKCADGRMCRHPGDCSGGSCNNNVCSGGGTECTDGKKDGQETDIDCGGPACPKCAVGKICLQPADCQEATCASGVCIPRPNCAAGTADCAGDAKCATITATDRQNCGACGQVCGQNAPYCVMGKCVQNSSVVIIHADNNASWPKDVHDKLSSFGVFSTVDLFDGQRATPSVQLLLTYSACLAYSNASFADPAAMGDNLAAYFDAGGRVVIASLANADPNTLAGRFGDPRNGYMLIAANGLDRSATALGKIYEPMSPLMLGVTRFNGGSLRSVGGVINNGIVVAEYQDGRPLIVRGTVNGHKLVSLNFFPPSGDAFNGGWLGDGAMLLRNALMYQ